MKRNTAVVDVRKPRASWSRTSSPNGGSARSDQSYGAKFRRLSTRKPRPAPRSKPIGSSPAFGPSSAGRSKRIAYRPIRATGWPPTKEKSRDRVLSEEEVGTFWRAADELDWPFGPLFKLLLLTAQRRDEVASMEWAEINLDTGLWTIPREKAKNDHGHDVQLSMEALAIIKALPRVAGPYVFSTNGKTPVSGFSRAKERLDGSMLATLKESRSRGNARPLDFARPSSHRHDRNGRVAYPTPRRRPHPEPHKRHDPRRRPRLQPL